MSAYTAYQLAQPSQSLLDSMTTRSFGPSVDPTVKKKGIMEDAQEKVEKAFKKAEKRSEKWKPVTTALDVAAGFMPPHIAAIIGAVSGGFSGYDRMRAFEGLKDDTKGIGEYSFMDDYMKNVDKQVRGLDTDIGDVIVSAGTGALKNFAMGKAGEAMAGLKEVEKVPGTEIVDEAGGEGLSEITKALDTGKDFGLKVPKEGFDIDKVAASAGEGASMKAPDISGEVSQAVKMPELDASKVAELNPDMVPQAPEATKITDASKRSMGSKGGGSDFEFADWVKKFQQEGGGKEMLQNMFGFDKGTPMSEILANYTNLIGFGQQAFSPLLNYNKPSDFRLY